MNMALNFYRYKTFVIFKSVTFEKFLKIMERIGDDAMKISNFSKVTQFLSLSKVSLLKFS